MAKEKEEKKKNQTSEAISEEKGLVPAKELNQLKGSTSSLIAAASALSVVDEKALAVAADILHTVKAAKDVIKKRKEEITRPLMNSLASVRDLFKPFEASLENAEKEVKQKVLDYQTAEEERIEKEKERIAKKVDSGKMKGETAIQKLGDLGEVAKSAVGSVGALQTRNITKVRVVDEALIPRMYLVPDMNKITEVVIRGGVDIPGVEKYTEKVMVSR